MCRVGVSFLVILFLLGSIGCFAQSEKAPKSPIAIVNGSDNILYAIFYTTSEVASIDKNSGDIVDRLKLDLPPTGLAISGDKLYVTISISESKLLEIDRETMTVLRSVEVGAGANSPIIGKKQIYVANQFDNTVSTVDLKSFVELSTIDLVRQPKAMDITPDGKRLVVANFLPNMRADLDTVTSEVSIVDIKKGRIDKNIALANGSNALRGLKVTPDGRYALVAHNLGRFLVPTSQLEQGWMNTSAISVIDLKNNSFGGTILLDQSDRGAAASWGIGVTESNIVVTHSGTHDFSIIDYPKFVAKLSTTSNIDDLSYDFTFLRDIRTRVDVTGNGPRAVLLADNTIYVASYFSDIIDKFTIDGEVVDLEKSYNLTPDLENSTIRIGEIAFHDASHCFQEWQACTGCHPDNARTDGLNWDLLNDGIGNQKNCKSMLHSHPTAPSMITGIRASAEIAVRAGFKYIQFATVPDSLACSVDQYLASLRAVPSPYLVDGELSESAKRGEKVFEDVNCTICHGGEYFTDKAIHTMGIQGKYDKQNSWDTPTLIEVWRTAPYLHDGRSLTMYDLLAKDKHGLKDIDLTEEELRDLTEYILSL